MRFKNLDLNLLVVLSLLLATKSVSESARRLNLSQPALSGALARLREYFGDPLLTLHGRRMMLTAFAESLAPLVERVIADVEAVTAATAVFDPALSEREFKLGVSDYLCLVLIAPLLEALRVEAPGVRLQMSAPSDDMISKLAEGDLDLIITPREYISVDHPSRLLFEEDHVVVGCASNPVFEGALGVDDFYALGHVAVELGRERRTSFAERVMSAQRRQRRVEVIAPSFTVVPWILPNTARLAVMHERLARLIVPTLPLRMAPVPFAIPKMQQMIQVHRARAADAGVNWLAQRLWSAAHPDQPAEGFTPFG